VHQGFGEALLGSWDLILDLSLFLAEPPQKNVAF